MMVGCEGDVGQPPLELDRIEEHVTRPMDSLCYLRYLVSYTVPFAFWRFHIA